MRRAIAAAALLAVTLLAIGLGVSGGSGAATQPGLAYETGTSAANPEVWLAGADGRDGHRLGSGSAPRLAPNGRLIAVSSVAGVRQALTLYSSSGTIVGRFFNAVAQRAVAQAWSPDSRYLAVVLSSTDPASDASSGLAVIDTRAGSYRVLAHGTIYGASFAPDRSDRLVYARAATSSLTSRVNVHIANADGTGDRALTRDGRSLYPLWGRLGIAFDRERLRRHADPAYELAMMSPDGTRTAVIAAVRVPPLFNGLVPLAFSDDGARLLAEYEGAETSQAWAVDVLAHRVRKVRLDGHSVSGAAISHSGTQLLIDRGGFLNPPDSGIVASVPFAGQSATTLVSHAASPSWNL